MTAKAPAPATDQPDAATYRDLGEAAWLWVLGQVRGDDGPWLPDVVADDASSDGGTGTDAEAFRTPASDRDSLYAGVAGLAPVLAEIRLHRELTETERALSASLAARLSAQAATRLEPSLFDGLGGDVTALKLLAPGQEQIAMRRLVELWPATGWACASDYGWAGAYTDVTMGIAGVVLAAAWAGGDDAREVVSVGADALLRVAEETDAGLDWRMHPGYRSSSPNYSHGTAGVGSALTIAGIVLGRADLIEAATAGAAHILAVGSLDDHGLVVPHTLPYSTRDVEPVTYNWCHGPAGTSQLFAALAAAGVEQVGDYRVSELRRRCLHSVLSSGVPRRLRPGFWDNDGRCCGTAGVGDVLLDAAQDETDDEYANVLFTAAATMAEALVERAIRDEAGARWRFIEHRVEQPLLPPRTSWMQGAAGIAAFLLRMARVLDGGRAVPVVDRPDQWWAVPAQLRLSAASSPNLGS